jgi:two-component system sensor histidine kinase BarA
LSYRTFKHLLGETSLERKCRFIFGGGILTLVTFSFYWYGQKTEQLVLEQTTEVARKLVASTGLIKLHLKKWHNDDNLMESFFNEVAGDRAPTVQNPDYELTIINPRAPKALGENAGADRFTREALAKFLQAERHSAQVAPRPDRKPLTFPDGSPAEMSRIGPGRKVYEYAQAVLFQPRCLKCHDSWRENAQGRFAPARPDDLAVAIVVKLPMDRTNREIHTNRAILISTALVTAILAMVASYVIVRYVIVKPVKHLRDVSDAIAAGRLNIRSQIHTGDEFEELSHAFNRMLHNLVAMQQELRDVNADLDKKVDELAQANLALFEMNRLKSDFLATMSHELRTPLNSIIGFSEVLAENAELPERQRRYAQNIQNSGKMLLGMINDILDLAKIESGKMEVQVEDFSIRDVCEGLVNLMRPMADRKNIDIECRLDEAIPLLRQDPGKIRQIIYNLLSNAVKFTPEGGRVTLRAQVEGRQVVISVADTGIGIAEEDRERIFEKFRQVSATGRDGSVLTREHQGTGLGLSIVRELARLLGGEIALESRPGQGSTFTVRVPLQLSGNRRFEVTLADERIDLSKARRVEPRPGAPHVPVLPGAEGLSAPGRPEPGSLGGLAARTARLRAD